MERAFPFASWPMSDCFPFLVGFRVSPIALELAGGATGLHDLFASRLAGFFRDRRAGFEVRHSPKAVVALGSRGDAGLIFVIAQDDLPGSAGKSVSEYHLLGVDAQRRMTLSDDSDQRLCLEPLNETFSAVRDLVLDWPEVIPVSIRTSTS